MPATQRKLQNRCRHYNEVFFDSVRMPTLHASLLGEDILSVISEDYAPFFEFALAFVINLLLVRETQKYCRTWHTQDYIGFYI